MGIIQLPDVGNLTKLDDLIRNTSIAISRISIALNGGISLAGNVQGKILTFSFSVANTNTKLSHGLGYTPRGYILIGQTVALSVYDGDGALGSEVLTLKSNTVGTARIYVF